jgi:hypothetical protein
MGNLKNFFSSTCEAAPTWMLIPFPSGVYFLVLKRNILSLLQSQKETEVALRIIIYNFKIVYERNCFNIKKDFLNVGLCLFYIIVVHEMSNRG